jgi:hypothetical protein
MGTVASGGFSISVNDTIAYAKEAGLGLDGFGTGSAKNSTKYRYARHIMGPPGEAQSLATHTLFCDGWSFGSSLALSSSRGRGSFQIAAVTHD